MTAVRGKAAEKPPEVQAIASAPDGMGRQIVVVSVGKDTDAYECVPFAADHGPAYRLAKLTGKAKAGEGLYDVSLHGQGQCCCKGFAFRGTCRHVRSLFALWASGALDTTRHAAAVLARLAGT